MRCSTCAFWFRGIVTHIQEGSKKWDGSPHPDAGKQVISRSWVPSERWSVTNSMNSGECRAAPLGITGSNFGCTLWKHDDGSDKFDHHFVKYAGQESLEQAIATVKEDTDAFEAEASEVTVTARFHLKNCVIYLEYAEYLGSHQLTYFDREATSLDCKNFKDRHIEFCNSMYL